MNAKINKALDYNKLLESQAEGKLLKKILKFPLEVSTKYDGNYVNIKVENGKAEFRTSGGLSYTHTDNNVFMDGYCDDGVYLAERIYGSGRLGDRDKCNLRGPKSNQTSTGHTYKIFDFLTLEEFEAGRSNYGWEDRIGSLYAAINLNSCIDATRIDNIEELNKALQCVVNDGYEGLMLMQPDWIWEDTKSRKINFCKYKKRRTADLLCFDIKEGEGKYEGMVGALHLKDSMGRLVSVGSGLSDSDRLLGTAHIGLVYEIEYERIAGTYIQPTIVRHREDKTEEDID